MGRTGRRYRSRVGATLLVFVCLAVAGTASAGAAGAPRARMPLAQQAAKLLGLGGALTPRTLSSMVPATPVGAGAQPASAGRAASVPATAGNWSVSPSLNPPRPNGELLATSCAGPSWCMAVGDAL